MDYAAGELLVYKLHKIKVQIWTIQIQTLNVSTSTQGWNPKWLIYFQNCMSVAFALLLFYG